MQITDTIIIINSSNRVTKVITPKDFPNDVIKWVIAIPTEQREEYKKVFNTDKLLLIPESVPKFLPPQRQWIMEHFQDKYENIWLMDDDLQFFKRNEELLLRKCETDEITEMFIAMCDTLKSVSMVGISTRLGNNRVTAPYDEINRCTRCYAMNTAAFKKVGATFAPFPDFCAEDFHMCLCFLNTGYKNRILHTFAQEDVGGSNADGGCSLYRTAEVQKRTSMWMAENHPEVSVKVKYSKGSWGLQELKDGRNVRVDVLVQWKKAYKPKKDRVKAQFNFLKK